MATDKITVTLDKDLIRGIRALAKRGGRSLSNMVQRLIKKALGLVKEI